MGLPTKFYLGDIVRLRKKHPCGADTWEVMRVGMDIRARCQGCGRVVLVPRARFERSVKEFVKRGIEEPGPFL